MRERKKFLAVAFVALFMITLLPTFALSASDTKTATIAPDGRTQLTGAVVGTYDTASITSYSWSITSGSDKFALYAGNTGDTAAAATAASVYVGAKSGVTLTSSDTATVKVNVGIQYASGSDASPTTTDDRTWTISVSGDTSTENVTGTSSSSSKDTPTPIVPVLYDITKAGDTFSYKVLIANGGGNMSGATVTVRLNDHYKSTVTIGSDGVGNGTLEAPGFAAGVAVFYARINGISNPGTTKPMVVSSSGRVLPR